MTVIQTVHDNWGTIITIAGALKLLVDFVANSLPAPTAESSSGERWWFKFINNAALNLNRAKNLARVEDSPNFLPAAEAYRQKKNAEEAAAAANKP